MALPEGSRVFLAYDVPPPILYHERLILSSCPCGRGYHIVLTPDLEMFPEQISLENEDLINFRIAGAQGYPHGLHDGNTYRFRAMPGADEMEQYRRDARHAAAALVLPPGAPAGAVAPMAAPAPPPVQVAAAVAPGEEMVWVRIESEGDQLRGLEVELDGSETLHGEVGIKVTNGRPFVIRKIRKKDIGVFKGREASADARLLGMSFQGLSRDERQWRDVSKEVTEEPFQDWSVPGPRTAQWCVRFLNRRNGGPAEHHRWWVHNHSLKPDNWGVTEHDTLMKIMDKLGRFDGLDLSNLAGAEIGFRRLQLIEYAYSDRGPGGGKGAPKGDKKSDGFASVQQYEASIFSGSHKEFGDTMVAPSLLEHVAKEVEGEASVMKQVRKAREERAAASKWLRGAAWALFWTVPPIGPLGPPVFNFWAMAPSVRHRGLFPFPVPQVARSHESAGDASRKVRRRLESQCHVDEWVKDIVISLNAMFSGSEEQGSFDGGGRFTLSQSLCLQRLRDAVLVAGKPPTDLSGQEALRELRTRTGYSGEPVNLVPLEVERLSLPAEGSRTASLETILQGEAESFVHRLHTKLSADGVVMERKVASGLTAPYMDPMLKRNSRAYAQFCRRLQKSGVVEFQLSFRERVGAFAVAKKNGKQRLVIDARIANLHFEPPEKVRLATGSTFSMVEVDDGPAIEVGGVDIADAFYNILLPESLRGLFALPGIRARDVGIDKCQGQSVGASTLVYPVLRVVPMGWTHALWICQYAHEAVVNANPYVDSRLRVVDKKEVPKLKTYLHTEYVDNFVVLTQQKGLAYELADRVGQSLRERGLPTHPVEAGAGLETLGWKFSSDHPMVQVTPKRMWKLRLATRELLRVGVCDGRLLERIIGHYTFAGLLQRGFLSIFQACYVFIRKHYDNTVQFRFGRKFIVSYSGLVHLFVSFGGIWKLDGPQRYMQQMLLFGEEGWPAQKEMWNRFDPWLANAIAGGFPPARRSRFATPRASRLSSVSTLSPCRWQFRSLWVTWTWCGKCRWGSLGRTGRK